MMSIVPAGFEDLLGDFLLDAAERMESLERALLDLDESDDTTHARLVRDIQRDLHTLKGNAAMMGLSDMRELAHRMEEITEIHGPALRAASLLPDLDVFRHEVQALAPAPAAQTHADLGAAEPQGPSVASARVPFATLDTLMDQLAETVILQNRLADAIARCAWNEVTFSHGALTRGLDDLRTGVMALRLMPLQMIFGSLRRIVHDESTREDKHVQLETVGGDTPLDKALLDVASEALGHLVRNAVIHGLETPAVRTKNGKSRSGTIRVSAQVRADEVRIEVSDDGAGIDPDRLREVAAQRGVSVPPDVFSVLFEPGFTTRAQADLSAGRGVGLSAVREAVRRQNGEIVIMSELGRGTTFRITLPMSVSITRALIVEADQELYALPLTSVVATRRLQPADGHRVNGAGALKWRGEVLTLLDLGCHFRTGQTLRTSGYVVVVNAGGRRRGLVADAIHGLREVVVKGLDPIFGRPLGVSGSTVLGDGRPILILDPRGLVDADPQAGRAA